MKVRTCLLAAIAVTLLTTTTFADGPFDKFIPRGRLLRKLRDDVLGTPEPKQPTPAKRPDVANQKGPTPATRPAGQQQQQQPTRPQMVNSGADGFGMAVVVDKQQRVVVAQVAPNGNAAEAGLQRGDVILEAGGVELAAIEEYKEIAKMLGAGDQLELKVARRGRPSKVMLQYGQPPSLKDVEVGDVDTSSNRASARSSEQRTANRYGEDFSFVPPADDDSRPGMRSVIERSAVPARPASTQQSAYRSAASAQQTQRQQLEQLRRRQSVTGSGLRTQQSAR